MLFVNVPGTRTRDATPPGAAETPIHDVSKQLLHARSVYAAVPTALPQPADLRQPTVPPNDATDHRRKPARATTADDASQHAQPNGNHRTIHAATTQLLNVTINRCHPAAGNSIHDAERPAEPTNADDANDDAANASDENARSTRHAPNAPAKPARPNAAATERNATQKLAQPTP